ALRGAHPSPAADQFYFTRETGAEAPAEAAGASAPLPAPPGRGEGALVHPTIAALFGPKGPPPEKLADEQRDLLVRFLAIPSDPRSPDAGKIVGLLAKCGEKV